jgi:hypothetical protein
MHELKESQVTFSFIDEIVEAAHGGQTQGGQSLNSIMSSKPNMSQRQFSRSESHIIQVDCPEYTYALRQEWRRGLKRAGRKVYPLPVDTLEKPALAPSDSLS